MSIFRENALKAIARREVLQTELNILTPSVFFGIIISLFIVLVLLGWGWYAAIPMTTYGAGVMVSEQEWNASLQDNEKTMQTKRQALREAEALLAKKRQLYQQHYLTENDMIQAERDYLEAKNVYATTTATDYVGVGSSFVNTNSEPSGNIALMIISNDDAKRIREGMKAYLYSRDNIRQQGKGVLSMVMHVTQYPISKELAGAYLGNANMVDQLFSQGVPYFAVLKTNERLQRGMLVSAKIITHTCRPLQLLMQSDC